MYAKILIFVPAFNGNASEYRAMKQSLTQHSQIESLRRKREELKLALAEILEHGEHLRKVEIPALRDKYDKLFRRVELSIQRKSLQAAELARREELFRTKLERGEKLTAHSIAVINEFVDREYARLHERLRGAAERESRRAARRQARLAEEESNELPGLFRDLVKKLHPDSMAYSEAFHLKYWQAAQEAYRRKNIARLRSLHQLICGLDDLEGPDGESVVESLNRSIQQMENRLHYERDKIGELETQEPLSFRAQIEQPDWIESRKIELQGQADELDAQIARRRQFLQSLLGDDWESGSAEPPKSSKQAANEEFDREFRERSYFSGR